MITFKEFLALSKDEQIKMYEQLNDHDKFLARMNDWSPEGVIVAKESTDPKDIERQERVQVMLVYIHTHYADELSLKDIADAGMMSIAQCNRCFNKMLNVTPYEYLIQYRLQKATNLLKDATLNVTEISEIVGFNNVTHFIQAFKKVYGISPKKYRMMEDQDEKGS